MKPTTQKLEQKTQPPMDTYPSHSPYETKHPYVFSRPPLLPPICSPPSLSSSSLSSFFHQRNKHKQEHTKMLNTEPKKPRLTTTTTTTTTIMTTTTDERPNESISVATEVSKDQAKAEEDDSGRERLKRHRMEMAGRVWIPEIWGQESFLKDWVDCSAFDSSLVPKGVVSARQALVEDCRRSNSARGLRIENRC